LWILIFFLYNFWHTWSHGLRPKKPNAMWLCHQLLTEFLDNGQLPRVFEDGPNFMVQHHYYLYIMMMMIKSVYGLLQLLITFQFLPKILK